MKISWQGREVEAREMGDGPAVVLLHGYPLDGAMWSGVGRLLSTRFRVIKPDLPGRGDNPQSGAPSLDAYAEFVSALLSQLPGKVGLAGFSMGGYVALALLRRRAPIAALALVDTRATADDAAGRAAREDAIATVQAKGVAAIAEAMTPKLLSADGLRSRDLAERVRRLIERQPPETVIADLQAMRDRPDSTDLLPAVDVPTLVLVGEADALTPPAASEAMSAAIPGARLVRIPGAGHLTPMERPRAVAEALGEFFGPALA
ncbi:MAG TPA: alpha/beta fold hydrolase [Thermoanaerobaculia bacterium]|jgi:pimeloyl-ACP methyl ester carboxylesterase